jgi:hypothetical protein
VQPTRGSLTLRSHGRRHARACRPWVVASGSVLVEVDPDTEGDGNADAAERDPGPGGPSAPQGAVGGIDVMESLPSDPDGWDAGQNAEEQAEHAEGEGVPGATVDRVRRTLSVWVGVHPGVPSRREVAERPVFGLPGRLLTEAPGEISVGQRSLVRARHAHVGVCEQRTAACESAGSTARTVPESSRKRVIGAGNGEANAGNSRRSHRQTAAPGTVRGTARNLQNGALPSLRTMVSPCSVPNRTHTPGHVSVAGPVPEDTSIRTNGHTIPDLVGSACGRAPLLVAVCRPRAYRRGTGDRTWTPGRGALG